jgi:branched-chain amino acid aminotransferase
MGLRADNLKAHIMVAAWNWPSYMSPEARDIGIKVRTSSYTRHHVNISMCKAKANGHYINSLLALQEALDCGCEEALLLDAEGYVAEGSGENFFLVRDGIIYTPELTSCLDGITRNTIFQLAADCGYTIKEKRLTRDEVYIADEAFFTGTAAEVLPIRELDGRQIGEGRRGPVTTRLQDLYFKAVRGELAGHTQWLAPARTGDRGCDRLVDAAEEAEGPQGGRELSPQCRIRGTLSVNSGMLASKRVPSSATSW